MTIDDIKTLKATDELRTLELKKTTGELKDGMHSLCAMLNSDGGYVIVGNDGNFGENGGENKLTDRQRIICDAIKANGNVTAKTLAATLAATLAVSARTIERELNILRKEGYITKEGKSNKGVWKVLK